MCVYLSVCSHWERFYLLFIDRVDVNQLYGITLDATQSFFSYKISYFKATVKKVKIKSNKNK